MELLPDTRRQEKLKPILLLLLHLFVVSSAADCPRPENGKDMVLSEAALLKNNFPEGSEVLLECARGFEKASGSGIITCIDNKWTEPDLICKKMDCGQPKPEPHMSFNTTGGTLFGSKIRIICEEGYWIFGTSYKHCYASGWFGKATCRIFTCAKPAEVENGKHSWNVDKVPEYGQVINFTCNEGYERSGNQSITCTTGKYDYPPPQCIERTTGKVVTSAPTSHNATTVVARIFTSISTTEPGKTVETLDIHKGRGYTAVIISVVVVTIAGCIIIFILNGFLMKRKGSYDTGEDLKPELLQFQTL